MARWFDDRFTALAMGFIFVVTILLGMLLAFPFMDMGYQAFEDPQDLKIPLMYIIMILVFTGIVLFLAKKGRLGIIQGLILFAMGMALMYVLFVPYGYGFWYLAGDLVYDSEYRQALDVVTLLFSLGTAAFLTYLLYRHPEWYVVDTLGVIVGAGVIGILGISLGILPIFVLLIVLAAYDAISVYKTKHMISLADTVIKKRLPVVLVMPKKEGYSFKKQPAIKKSIAEGAKREAMFMGLGDIVFPGSLVVSAMTFLSTDPDLHPTGQSLAVATCTLIGAIVGYAMLMRFVLKGKPQAGLPLLNAGAILGFAAGYLIWFVI